MCCQRLREFALSYLRISALISDDVDSWLLAAPFGDETVLIKMPLLQYAAYRLRNFHAHSASLLSSPLSFSFLKRVVIQGASGHNRCRAVLRALGTS